MIKLNLFALSCVLLHIKSFPNSSLFLHLMPWNPRQSRVCVCVFKDVYLRCSSNLLIQTSLSLLISGLLRSDGRISPFTAAQFGFLWLFGQCFSLKLCFSFPLTEDLWKHWSRRNTHPHTRFVVMLDLLLFYLELMIFSKLSHTHCILKCSLGGWLVCLWCWFSHGDRRLCLVM